MKNKCIKNNWKIFNKIKFAPISLKKPEDLKDINEWAERTWNHLINDDLKRHKYFCEKGKHGFTISVWSDETNVYLIQVVRTEYDTDEILIYGAELNDNNLNDFCAIAKFIRYNIKSIIGHSQNAVHELNKMVKAMEIQKEVEHSDGEA